MNPDQGPGIPGWFVAFFIIAILVGIGTMVWRVSLARKVAEDAGLDPNTATAVTLLSKDGVDAAYLASTLSSRNRSRTPDPTPSVKTTEQRLQELQDLKTKGLITQQEHDARRQSILGSI